MRSYSQRRVYYIYREYFRMLQTANLDPIIIGPSSDDTLGNDRTRSLPGSMALRFFYS